MPLICCPLQCGKFITSIEEHITICPNKEKLGKYCEICPYNNNHILSKNALMSHIHYCPNNPKNISIEHPKEKEKKIDNEIIPLKTGFPPLNVKRPKVNIIKKEIKKKIEHERILLEEEEKINNSYNDKIKEINNYFAELKFYETITPEFLYNFNLDVLIYYQIDLKNQYEEELKKYYTKKIEDKKKDWNGQIERAKWRVRVQAFGEMKCEGGCNLSDNVACSDKSCEGLLFWVDSDEKYAICDKCPESKCITKISGNLFCKGCGSKSLAEVKWIKGYKP